MPSISKDKENMGEWISKSDQPEWMRNLQLTLEDLGKRYQNGDINRVYSGCNKNGDCFVYFKSSPNIELSELACKEIKKAIESYLWLQDIVEKLPNL